MNNAALQLDNECNACARVTSPLQGEGEGEGFKYNCAILETPHLNPLPLPNGRGEKTAQNLLSWNVGADDVKHRKEKPPKAFVV